jgi:hypothetical protein
VSTAIRYVALAKPVSILGIDAAVWARAARACSTSSDETRPACRRQVAIWRLSSAMPSVSRAIASRSCASRAST